MNDFTYTEEFYVVSSLIDSVYYNANDRTAVLDVNDRIYRYSDVDRDDVEALANGRDSNGSVGAHYNRVFKTKYGPGEYLGDYDEVDYDIVPVEGKPTPKDLREDNSPEPSNRFAFVSEGSTTEWSLGTPDTASTATATKEYSLTLPEPASVVEDSDVESVVVTFTLEGFDREFEYEANSSDLTDAVEELHNHVKAFGAKGRVRKAVVTFV